MDADGIERPALHVPVGTATFMLTDVEGSARLQECAPDTVGAAVVRHGELLDEAASRHGGVRWQREGYNEGVVVAFTRASEALAAALDIQRAVQFEDWPEGASLKVRIALHTVGAQQRARSHTADRWCCPRRRETWSSTGSLSTPNSPTSAFIGCVTSGVPSTFSDCWIPICRRSFHR